MYNYPKLEDLIGRTAVEVSADEGSVTFHMENGDVYQLTHIQDCCEYVYLEDINGDLSDLVGVPILQAEEVSSLPGFEEKPLAKYEESWTWTFYKFATIKGYVTIRFYGSSNGYYSESVDFVKV